MTQDERDQNERNGDERDQNAVVPHKPRRDMVAFHTSLLKTVVKLFIISLLVGMVMHWFDITPRSLVANFGQSIEHAVGTVINFIRWAIDYVVVGAVVVVPIWLIAFLINWATRKRDS